MEILAEVYADPENPKVIYLKFKSEAKPKKIDLYNLAHRRLLRKLIEEGLDECYFKNELLVYLREIPSAPASSQFPSSTIPMAISLDVFDIANLKTANVDPQNRTVYIEFNDSAPITLGLDGPDTIPFLIQYLPNSALKVWLINTITVLQQYPYPRPPEFNPSWSESEQDSKSESSLNSNPPPFNPNIGEYSRQGLFHSPYAQQYQSHAIDSNVQVDPSSKGPIPRLIPAWINSVFRVHIDDETAKPYLTIVQNSQEYKIWLDPINYPQLCELMNSHLANVFIELAQIPPNPQRDAQLELLTKLANNPSQHPEFYLTQQEIDMFNNRQLSPGLHDLLSSYLIQQKSDYSAPSYVAPTF